MASAEQTMDATPVPGTSPAATISEWWEGAPLPTAIERFLGLGLPGMVMLYNLWSVRAFTVDDAYITFRYSRNFARGLGLVYNVGERIEGYTNFLWTVLLGVASALGIDPEIGAKVLGGAAALGTLALLYQIERELRPVRWFPCVSPWLLATSAVNVGYAVWGLETSFFVCMLMLGTWLMMRERRSPERTGWRAIPWSGAAFALAGLTRPEAPMYLGLLMLSLGRDFFRKENLLRGTIFVVPIALHMLWRHGYYGSWLPNTLGAKTGNLDQQLAGGTKYLTEYMGRVGHLPWLGMFGLGWGIHQRNRWAIAFAVIAFAVVGYVLLVGGDWMPYHRFLAPFEPYAFILVGVGVRSLFELRDRVATVALIAFLLVASVHRGRQTRAAFRFILHDEMVFWNSAAGGVAEWLLEHPPGMIGVADIGQIGYRTDYPLFDLLGLVDPVISKLPGGYTRKTGSGYVERVFERAPRYFVFVGKKDTCVPLAFPAQEKLRRDPRFQLNYGLAGQVRHSKDGLWCVFERKDLPGSSAK